MSEETSEPSTESETVSRQAPLPFLIKLAAAGVKGREGRPVGVQRHLDRAWQLLNTPLDDSPPPPWLQGIDWAALLEAVRSLEPETLLNDSHASVVKTMPFSLEPHHR